MNHPAPDDVYKHDVDFTALALQYPDFAKRLKPNRQLDFTDPESVRQLTLSLLHRDFNLTVHLPPTRLCPPVPNRFTYILHLQRLLDCTSPSFRDVYDPRRQVLGIDIGCGASCIYPLLACAQREEWRMLATEIDDMSRGVARQNLDANGLKARVRILDTDPTSKKLIPVDVERFERIDFLMTNPPFYASHEQILASAKAKSRPPNSSCTGAAVEMIYPHPQTGRDKSSDTARAAPGAKPTYNDLSVRGAGPGAVQPSVPRASSRDLSKATAETETEAGEILFLTQILNESLHPKLRHRIQWFTGMLGHLSSLHTIVQRIKERGCENFVVWEFVHHQGQEIGKDKERGKKGGKGKTRRWAVGWSWMGLRPTVEVARGGGLGGGVAGVEKRFLPFPSEVEIEIELNVGGRGGRGGRGSKGLEALGERIDEIVSELEVDEDDSNDSNGNNDDDNGGARERNRGGVERNRGAGVSGSARAGIQWQYKPQQLVGVGMSRQGDCWSRKARRKRQQQRQHNSSRRGRARAETETEKARETGRRRETDRDVEMKDADADPDADPDANDQRSNKKNKDQEQQDEDDEGDEDDEEEEEDINDPAPALVFKISIRRKAKAIDIPVQNNHRNPNIDIDNNLNLTTKPTDKSTLTSNSTPTLNNADMAIVHIRWLQGQDSVIFESFCGWLKRKISH